MVSRVRYIVGGIVIIVIVIIVIILATSGGSDHGEGGKKVVFASNGISIATFGTGGLGIRLANGNLLSNALPSGVSSFDDVAVDGNLVFALSTQSRVICSFTLNSDGTLTAGNCVGGGTISVAPFTGIAALGGNIVVSGGTGGVSQYTYDTTTGTIADAAVISNSNAPLRNVSGLDVTMMTPTLVALSAVISGTGADRFGIIVADISFGNLASLGTLIPINGSQFANSLGPANFPLESALLTSNGKGMLYIAHGVLIAVGDVEITGAPSGFEAVTVAVNLSGTRAYFGGLNNGASFVLTYDTTQPLTPSFIASTAISGRITSIAANDEV